MPRSRCERGLLTPYPRMVSKRSQAPAMGDPPEHRGSPWARFFRGDRCVGGHPEWGHVLLALQRQAHLGRFCPSKAEKSLIFLRQDL